MDTKGEFQADMETTLARRVELLAQIRADEQTLRECETARLRDIGRKLLEDSGHVKDGVDTTASKSAGSSDSARGASVGNVCAARGGAATGLVLNLPLGEESKEDGATAKNSHEAATTGTTCVTQGGDTGTNSKSEVQTVAASTKHQWVKGNTRWQCAVCLANTMGLTLSSKRISEKCKGRADGCTNEADISKGHKVDKFVCNGEALLVCERCGAFSSKNLCEKFRSVCEEPTKWGKQVLNRVYKEGVHPKTIQKFDIGSENPVPTESGSVLSRHSATVRAIGRDTKQKKTNWNLGQGTRTASVTGEPTKEDLDDILEQEKKNDSEFSDNCEQEDLFFGTTHAETAEATTTSTASASNATREPRLEVKSADIQAGTKGDSSQQAKNRDKLIGTLVKKRALHGIEALTGVQRAILHDTDAPKKRKVNDSVTDVVKKEIAREQKAVNRASMIGAVLKKKALHGFEALSGMQKAIIYDVEAKKRNKVEPVRDPDKVLFENWEMVVCENANNTQEHEDTMDSEGESEAQWQGGVDEDFKDDFIKYIDTLKAQELEACEDKDQSTQPVELPLCEIDSEVLGELIRMHNEGCAVVWPDGVNELVAKNILEARKRLRDDDGTQDIDTSQGEERAGKKARSTSTTCLQVFAIDSDESDIEVCDDIEPHLT